MAQFLLLHGPHLAVALAAFGAVVYSAVRARPVDDDAAAFGYPPAAPAPRLAGAPGSRARRVARLGLLALGPLVLALATGLWCYGVALTGGRPAGWLLVLHAAASTLALLQVTHKVAAVGVARLSSAVRNGKAIASVALALLGVPLVVTGAALLLHPAPGSPLAYAHLIAAAWWTVLLTVHLWRHLPRALGRYARVTESSPTISGTAAVAPSATSRT